MFYTKDLSPEEQERLADQKRRARKREARIESILSCVRVIFYTPLSIAFHAISFVSRGIGCVASFGMLVGLYYVYLGVCDMGNGISFGEIEAFGKAVPFFTTPFAAYAVSEITDRIYFYFARNAC